MIEPKYFEGEQVYFYCCNNEVVMRGDIHNAEVIGGEPRYMIMGSSDGEGFCYSVLDEMFIGKNLSDLSYIVAGYIFKQSAEVLDEIERQVEKLRIEE